VFPWSGSDPPWGIRTQRPPTNGEHTCTVRHWRERTRHPKTCIIPGSADAPEKMTNGQQFDENHPVWLDHHEMSKMRVQ